MHASLSKQIAFNRRVLSAEEQIAGINLGLGDFLQDMSFDESEPLFVCVGGNHAMRGTKPIGGQYWRQGNRETAAINVVLDGMDGGQESVLLSAIHEAVDWRHTLEMAADPCFKRPGQRVVVYPASLSKFALVMATWNAGYDLEGGHCDAYERIFAECDTFANRPIFVAADREAIGSWPVVAKEVSIWMEQTREIALAGHGQVHQDGRDACRSESDSEHSDHGEDIPYESAYTQPLLGPGGKPKFGGPLVLSGTQAFVLRAVARQSATLSGSTGVWNTTDGESVG
jgi:hypothetical protein